MTQISTWLVNVKVVNPVLRISVITSNMIIGHMLNITHLFGSIVFSGPSKSESLCVYGPLALGKITGEGRPRTGTIKAAAIMNTVENLIWTMSWLKREMEEWLGVCDQRKICVWSQGGAAGKIRNTTLGRWVLRSVLGVSIDLIMIRFPAKKCIPRSIN